MKYLALASEERIKLQAQPFDGKKQCWAPDAKESFVAAEITNTKGEEVIVKTSKGDVRLIAEYTRLIMNLIVAIDTSSRMSH
jgi:hypothetical protein